MNLGRNLIANWYNIKTSTFICQVLCFVYLTIELNFVLLFLNESSSKNRKEN